MRGNRNRSNWCSEKIFNLVEVMMSMGEMGIEYKKIEPMLVSYIRFNLKDRAEIPILFDELAHSIPQKLIAGAPYLILQYFSSYSEGFEAEVGFPVKQPFESDRIKCKTSLAMEVLSIRHDGPLETLRETKLKLQEFTSGHCLISDEFTREVYPDWDKPVGVIEAQYVIHDWNELFSRNLVRVLGQNKRDQIMQGVEKIGVESSPAERFQWVKGAVERLEGLADDFQKYDVVSACAHIYPPGQLQKLRRVFEENRANSCDSFQAVDAVLKFMAADPGWGEKGAHREGRILYHTKNPADPEGYAQAKTVEEKRRSYCFCPIIRGNLDKGMPVTYCYCGSGWYRQQWETATGKPVRVEVLESILKGDDICRFAVHLAEDI
jgi:effector-binding domain-containing protein